MKKNALFREMFPILNQDKNLIHIKVILIFHNASISRFSLIIVCHANQHNLNLKHVSKSVDRGSVNIWIKHIQTLLLGPCRAQNS